MRESVVLPTRRTPESQMIGLCSHACSRRRTQLGRLIIGDLCVECAKRKVYLSFNDHDHSAETGMATSRAPNGTGRSPS